MKANVLNTVIILASLLVAGCATSRKETIDTRPALSHLGQHAFRITTSSSAAQKAFDRGLNWAYSFGHFAAEQEFRRALAVAALTLDGEMLAKEDQLADAVGKLRAAVALEDKLVYDEPPDWIQPVRHTLGAVLMRAKRTAEAESVYREDLKVYPENGWSLMGLRDALAAQGRNAEAAKVDRRFQKQWAKADIKPPSTCYCQTPPKP